MKKLLVIIFINILLVLLQTSFFSEILNPELNPVLILSYAFALLFMDKKEEAMLSAFTGGLLVDLLGTSLVGLSSGLFLILILLVFFIRQYVFRNWFFQLILVAFSALSYKIFLLGSLQFSRSMITGAVLTALLVLLFYFLNGFFFKNLFYTKREYASDIL